VGKTSKLAETFYKEKEKQEEIRGTLTCPICLDLGQNMMARNPNAAAEHDSAATSNHFVEIIRPEMLGHWAIESNPSLQYLHEAMQDWGERRGDPNRRPVCLTCPHEFHVNASMPSAWMFVRLSVNKGGVPRHMVLVGICETCAVKNNGTLLQEGCAELRRAFPDVPEFKMLVIQEASRAASRSPDAGN
jgi:hypothetical protein